MTNPMSNPIHTPKKMETMTTFIGEEWTGFFGFS